MKKYLLHIFSFLLLWITAEGQLVKKYAFTHYGATQGVASNEVICTVQDQEGYLWIGSSNGLQRYDGVRFLTFRSQKGNPSSLPGNLIQQLLIDKKGNLWLIVDGTRVGRFDTKRFIFQEVQQRPSEGTSHHSYRKIVEDEQGNIMLVYANHELLTYNSAANEFSAKHNFIHFPREWGLVDLIHLKGTSKYILGTQNGLAVFDRKTGQLSNRENNTAKEPLIERFGNIRATGHFMLDKSNRLWFDAWDGAPTIYCYDMKHHTVVLDKYSLLSAIGGYHEVHGFVQQKNGVIWVFGLDVFGEFMEKEKKFRLIYNGYENEQSIAYTKVTHLTEDKEGNLWVTTNNNGLYSFNPGAQFFTNVRHLNRINGQPGDGSVMSFSYLKDGTLLAGTWGDGLYRYDSNFNQLPLNMKGRLFSEKGTPSIWGMCESADNHTIWMAAQPGIYRYNQATGQVTFYNPPAFNNRTVRQIGEDRYGNLWIGTQSQGVYKWTAEKGKKNFNDGISHIKEIPQAQVSKIYIDKRGFIWAGVNGWGLYRIDPATDKVLQHFGSKEPAERKLQSDAVADIIDYNDSIMVIAAGGLMTYHVRQQKIIKTIGSGDAIAGEITALEKDKTGYIWASSTTGIYRINIYNNIFIRFDRVDGIGNDYFIFAASKTLPDGRILFGADNQFVAFDPSKVQINNVSPEIKITGFRLMNQSLLLDSLVSQKRINLLPKDNSIAIEFAGMSYNNAYLIRYKMEGLDKDWKIADKNCEAVYSYLPHGNYTFLVRSEDAEGKPGTVITKLAIRVKPPFWKTWWFLGLVIFAVTAILFWLDKLRLQKLRATESIRTRIATSLTEDMSNSLSSINISSELAKTKIDSDTQRTKEYIAQISETSNRMVQAMYDMVWSIDPKNDTMTDTIDRMKSFAVETENTFPISVDFDIDKQVERLKLDMEHRYELLCIFKEAVNNAARHSGGRFIKVSLRFNSGKLLLMIVDDGRGFSMNDATILGRGISDMRRRAAIINAILYIESEINTGTIVKLEMPV